MPIALVRGAERERLVRHSVATVLTLIGLPRGRGGRVRALLAGLWLVVCLAFPGRVSLGQFFSYLDESEKARVLLEQAQGRLDEGRPDLAVGLITELLKVSEDAVLPQSGRGARLAVREMILGLPPAARELYLERVGPEAAAALRAAEAQGSTEAYCAVARNYPATPAAHLAAQKLWALCFEQGDFARAADCLRAHLAEPSVDVAARRRGLFILGLAADKGGDRATLAESLALLKALPQGPAVQVWGLTIDPVAHLEKLLAGPAERRDVWPTLGGGPQRNSIASADLAFRGALRIWLDRPPADATKQRGGTMEVGVPPGQGPQRRPARPGRGPATREELLRQAALRPSQFSETFLLATRNSLLVLQGGELVALDRSRGLERWRLRVSPPGADEMPVACPSCGEGYVAAMVAADGGPEAAQQPDARRLAAKVLSPIARSYGMAKRLLVLDELTGARLWSWEGSAAADERTAAQDAGGIDLEPAGAPLIYGGRLFVGAAKRPWSDFPVDCYLLCFDLKTAALQWQRFVGSGVITIGNPRGTSLERMVPATDGRRVYVESAVGTCAAVDLATACVAWARKFERPQFDRGQFLPPAAWPSAIPDAPTAAGERVIFTDLVGPSLRCLEARTGRTLWEAPMKPGWRLGLREGLIYFAGESSLAAYDVETGRQSLSVALPSAVCGRGFLAEDAAYVPTEAQVVRVALKDSALSAVVGPDRLPGSAAALAPLGKLVLCSDLQGLWLFGHTDELIAEVRRAAIASPRWPLASLWLADLHRQQGDFEAAERRLRAAMEQIAAVTDAQLADELKERSRQAVAEIYRLWSDQLMHAGRRSEALAKLSEALDAATAPENKLAIRLSLAACLEALGRARQAEDNYAAVAGDPLAETLLVPATSPQLRRTLAAQAELSLLRLRGHAAETPKTVGLARGDVGKLAVVPLAMLSWSSPSYALCASRETFAPIVWVRPTGLAAMATAGRVRWLCDKTPGTEPIPSTVEVSVAGVRPQERGLVCASDGEALSAYDLACGDLIWRWRPQDGRVLPKPPAAKDLIRCQAVDHVRASGLHTLLDDELDVFGRDVKPFCMAEGAVVVAAAAEGKTPPRLYGLDRATGSMLWHTELPSGSRLRGLAAGRGSVFAVLQTDDVKAAILCLDDSSGGERWREELPVPRLRRLRCLVGETAFVYDDATGRCGALDLRDGKPLWRDSTRDIWLAGAAPVAATADVLLFSADQGYLAVSMDGGRVLWRREVPVDSPRAPWPVAAGSLLVAWAGDTVFALDLRDGRQAWEHCLGEDARDGCGLAVCGDLAVVYGCRPEKPKLTFIDLADGRPLGEFDLGEGGGFLDVSPVVGGLFVRCGDRLLAVVPASAVPRGTTGEPVVPPDGAEQGGAPKP